MTLDKDFVPKREADLDEFVHNFDTRITATPTAFGLVAGQATAFHALVVAWDAAYAITKNIATRSQSAVIVKDEKKFFMVKNLRQLSRIIQAYPAITNEQRSLLGLTVPTQRQSRPAPGSEPRLDITGVVNNTIKVRLSDSVNPTRKRPATAVSANVFSYVGDEPPTTAEGWFFQGGSTRNVFDVAMDPSLPIGTKVWLTAFWKNERDQSGPACQPVSVQLMGTAALPGFAMSEATETKKLAA